MNEVGKTPPVDGRGKTEAELIKIRREKAQKLEAMGISPYPAKSFKNYANARIHEIHETLMESNEKVFAAGRISSIRGHGKLNFIDITDESGKLQVILRADELGEDFKIAELLDLGDFLEAEGHIMLSNSGEVSLTAKHIRILTKAIRPMPSSWHGLKDDETRMRKRYLELAGDPELRELFKKKTKFWATIRNFLIDNDFLEVETPVLETTTGGADANPFETHHNALNIPVYLRISCGELWQKRLLVAGFDKVFEIGRIFRNEGISAEHLQDYTQMEFYWGYADYEKGMKFVKEMYQKIAKEVFGTSKFQIGEYEVDFEGEWPEYDYTATIKKHTGINIEEANLAEIKNKLSELKVTYEKEGFNKTRAVDNLWKYCRKKIAGPGFLVNVPDYMEPLAKRSHSHKHLVERFQVIIAGSEVGKGYSELNDPVDQRERFIEQQSLRDAGDAEAQMYDKDFVEALEYGMPPACGFGLSERLFSFLANKPIRECVLFPLVRPEGHNQKLKK